MAELNWQTPAPAVTVDQLNQFRPSTNRTKELNELASQLKAHPGQWALVGQRSRSGGGDSYKRRGLEVTTRLRKDGMFDVFVRAPA